MRLSVYPDGLISVSAPKWYPLYLVEKFLESRSSWILGKIKETGFSREREKKDYLGKKEAVRELVGKKIKVFNRNYGFSIGRISIKRQRSCWGSASLRGNLNFNYKIINLPESLQDYIIVHELCHLRELNHGLEFWKLVEKVIPDFRERRKELKKVAL